MFPDGLSNFLCFNSGTILGEIRLQCVSYHTTWKYESGLIFNLPQTPGTPIHLNGRHVSLIGNISMDMIAVDLGPGATDRVGDIATLWGDGLPAEEVAPWADAIPYDLVCGVTHREDAEYVD